MWLMTADSDILVGMLLLAKILKKKKMLQTLLGSSLPGGGTQFPVVGWQNRDRSTPLQITSWMGLPWWRCDLDLGFRPLLRSPHGGLPPEDCHRCCHLMRIAIVSEFCVQKIMKGSNHNERSFEILLFVASKVVRRVNNFSTLFNISLAIKPILPCFFNEDPF